MMAASRNDCNWTLATLLDGITAVSPEADVQVRELANDTRHMHGGEVFLAYPGYRGDGREYIDEAMAQDANAILFHLDDDRGTINWQRAAGGSPVPVIGVPRLKDQVGVIADRFFGSPSKSMSVIGVTGTNGKTSCTHYLAQAFGDHRCGIIGTLGRGFPGELHSSSHTTPDVLTVHRWLADLRDAGAQAVAMEVSSHALDQGRVDGVHFDCAVFTNLSHEHLDYHGDMQSYGKAKRLLFESAEIRFAVINRDDPFGQHLLDTLPANVQGVSYGATAEGEYDIHATHIGARHDGLHFLVDTPQGRAQVHTSLLGRFNVYNVVAVLAVLLDHGVPLNEATERVAKLRAVPGRMQRFVEQGYPLIVVDYAHTPAALEHVLQALREHTQGELWCVFGCGGDRDPSKRAPMGSIAEMQADHIILTNDNPRREDPAKIVADIQSEMTSPQDAEVIFRRDEAIAHALSRAREADTVLIAGKGHEDYQLIGDQRLPFSDAQQVISYLRRGRP